MATKKRSCWIWLEEGLYSFCMECTIVVITLINMLIITAELLINLRIITVPNLPVQHYPSSSAISNRNSSVPEEGSTTPIDPGDEELAVPLQTAQLVCHYFSMAVSAFFLFEISFKMLIKNREFFQDKWQILDAVVVIVTFTLELLLTLIEDKSEYWEIATYVIVLRLWRLGRMCQRNAESFKSGGEIEVIQYEESRQKEEENLRRLQIKLDKQEREIRRLESMLRRYQQDHNIDSNRNNTETLLEILESKGQFDRYAEDKSNTIIANATEEVRQLRRSLSGKPSNGHIPSKAIDRQDSQDVQSDSEANNLQVHFGNNQHLFRADSESSMSQDGGLTTVHKVMVDVEGVKCQPNGTAVTDQRDPGSRDNTDGEGEEHFVYTNQSFETDVSLDDRNWPVLSEIDGTKTYRSAEGIQMTSL